MADKKTSLMKEKPEDEVRSVAVIELGTSSIRMAIAQVDDSGIVKMLETLSRSVSLGEDTFTSGNIGAETTEECVRVLRSFRRVLSEYHVDRDDQIMAIATSAVREAGNKDAFLDRIYVGTDIKVRIIDEAEVNRFTYLALSQDLKKNPVFKDAHVLVVEVGGGSTEVLTLKKGQVGHAHAYRLGSLRVREMLESQPVPASEHMEILENQVERTADQIAESVTPKKDVRLVALGGDARFAASHILQDWNKTELARVKSRDVSSLAREVLKMDVDDVVRRFHVSYPEAETLGPALLLYSRLAKKLKRGNIYVGNHTVRNGVLLEMASGGSWTDDFEKQVVNSAMGIARKYKVDVDHAKRVAEISRQLFEALHDEHRLDKRCRVILSTAALLHESGAYLSNRSHHKHSSYLILHSDIFGMGTRDLTLTALTARYHRRAMPRRSHQYYCELDQDERVIVNKLSAILRLSDSLSRRGQKYRGTSVDITIDKRAGVITIGLDKPDLTLEEYSIRQKGGLFDRVYGLSVRLRSTSKRTSRG